MQMMTSVETYLRRGRKTLGRWWSVPKVRLVTQGAFLAGSGFVLSAAALMESPQPLAVGLTAALTGWRCLAAGLGAMLGYRIFWGQTGFQGMVWTLGGALCGLLLGKREDVQDQPLLIPALCALVLSAAGVGFQLLGETDTTLPVYLTRVVLAAASALMFARVVRRGDTLMDWIAEGTAVLALSRVLPIPWLNLGTVAAGILAVGGAFPAAALAGMGLDLARITAVPMTAVLCAAYLTRMIPGKHRLWRMAAPAAGCVAVMGLCGVWDVTLLPGLLAGGALGLLMPPRVQLHHRRGETGLAQVRLELSARILQETRSRLLEPRASPVDERAVLEKAIQNACGSCSARANCTAMQKLSLSALQNPLEVACRKPGRLMPELQRGQERLRQLRSDRQRREEYRLALVQQYDFLADYLRSLADKLPRRGERIHTAFSIQCAARSAGRETANGDRCLAFPGTEGRYFVLLCDGMGTGLGAAREGDSAAALLRQMLTIGFPAALALRSLNSILTLRGKGGAVTMDLAEVDLSTGTAVLYKWGAAPSFLLKKAGAEKIETATPPPGLSVEEARESSVRLSLRRGEVLILISDGVEAGETLRRMEFPADAPPGELAQSVLDGCGQTGDDATVAVIRLQKLR